MPHKKNPDLLELVRGHAGRAPRRDLAGFLAVLKGLPLSYDKDLQLDKEPVFRLRETLAAVLPAVAELAAALGVDRPRMRAAASDERLLATDLADALAARGVPFRKAHAAVGRRLARARASRASLAELPPSDGDRTARSRRARSRPRALAAPRLRRNVADPRPPRRGRRPPPDRGGAEGAMRLPSGFVASGVRSGVRKSRPDLALIVCEKGATAAALFTRNRFPAAPVVLSRAALRRTGGTVRAAVVNSGCANAITGREGTEAARRVRRRAAELLRCRPEEIFLASTGVIGVPLPDAQIRAALPAAVTRLSSGGLEAASHAILTTDVGPKVAAAAFRAAGKRGRVVGFAKGAGMIHPNMATMLAFVLTDASVAAGLPQESAAARRR